MRTNWILHPRAMSIFLFDPPHYRIMWYSAELFGTADITRFLPPAGPIRPASSANLQGSINISLLDGFDIDSVHLVLGPLQIALERRNAFSYSGREISQSRVNIRSLS